ncbi:hypothetical protein RQCS_58130 (plasmid) [Rhodococcus qingshengii]|nr:hypothetical protein [Rhodococcus qingshengii]BCF86268.1 hypothetical protein RQCS_58130 [Rhodococcus qingshengii]
MSDKSDESSYLPTVGSRVQITTRHSGTSGGVVRLGVVIEDYTDSIPRTDSVDRDWARVHRWAIALDDGRLIFADDDDLTAAEALTP